MCNAQTDPERPRYLQYAEEALVTAVFCIIICCAWGTLIIRSTAGFLLEKVPPPPGTGPRGLLARPLSIAI